MPPKGKHGLPPDKPSPEEFSQKLVLEANPKWSDHAKFLLKAFAKYHPRAFTVEELTRVSEEEIRGSAYAFSDESKIEVNEGSIEIGILEIEQWLDENNLALSPTASYESDSAEDEDN
jgi:hypothetical protein